MVMRVELVELKEACLMLKVYIRIDVESKVVSRNETFQLL